jgi:hypothetical protein
MVVFVKISSIKLCIDLPPSIKGIKAVVTAADAKRSTHADTTCWRWRKTMVVYGPFSFEKNFDLNL